MIASALYVPPALLGLGDSSGNVNRPDSDLAITLNVVVGANATISATKQIPRDADFLWRAIIVASATGLFQVRFNVNRYYYFEDAPVVSTIFSVGDPASPYPRWPEYQVPAGGVIGADITDLSGGQNTIQFVFRGASRFV